MIKKNTYNKKKGYVFFIVLSLLILFFSSSYKTHSAGACKTGPFNPEGKLDPKGCPYLSINGKTGESNATVLRIFAKKTSKEVENIAKNSNAPYVMPANEPDIDTAFSAVKDIKTEIINQINAVLKTGKIALIPAFSNNIGSIKSNNYGSNGIVKQIINGLQNKNNVKVAVNIYTGVENPLNTLESMISQLKSSTNLGPLIITELGIAPGEQAVSNGCMSKKDWLFATARLQKELYDRGFIGTSVELAFSALIEADGTQTPVFYDPITKKGYYPNGEISLDQMDKTLDKLKNNSKSITECMQKGALQQQNVCEAPKETLASPSCAKCALTERLINVENKGFIENLINKFTALITFKFKTQITLKDDTKITPVAKAVSKNSGILKTENSKRTPLSFIFPQVAKEGNGDEKEVLKRALEIKNIEGVPKQPNISALILPGKEKCLSEIPKKIKEPGLVKIYVDRASGGKPLKYAGERLPTAQSLTGWLLNSYMGLPGNGGLFSWETPPCFTEQEYLGNQYAARKEYLAIKKTNFLSKNYSEEDKNKLVFEYQKNNKIENKNEKNFNKIQKTSIFSNVWQAFKNNVCALPKKESDQLSFRGKNIENSITLDLPSKKKSGTCTNNNGNINCDKSGDTTTVNVAVLFSGYTGKEADSEITGVATENITGTQAIQERKNALITFNKIASNKTKKSIELIANNLKKVEGMVNLGVVPARQVLANFFSAPPENYNEIPSGKHPLDFKVVEGAFENTGDVQITSDTIIPNERSAYCLDIFKAKDNFIPTQKDSPAYKLRRSAEKYCRTKQEYPNPSYCSTSSIKLTNNSSNLEVEVGYTDPRAEGSLTKDQKNALKKERELREVPQTNILNDNSNIILKLATRVVDGATLLVNNAVVPINPGQTSAQRCSGITNGTGVEVLYLPIQFAEQAMANPNDLTLWGIYGRRLIVNNVGNNTNAEYELRVNPGVYRIAVRTNPCTSSGFKVTNTTRNFITSTIPNNPDFFAHLTGPFILEDTNIDTKKRSFCAKVTINSNMPGGGYANKSKENQTKAGSCTLSNAYDVGLNTACGGLGGTITDSTKWKNISKPGLESYKLIFGRDFKIENSCNEMFPSTIQEVPCGEANNTDIKAFSNNNTTLTDTTNYSNLAKNLNPPWEEQTPGLKTGIKGTATYYAKGVMDIVLKNRVSWGQIDPSTCPDCKGYVAMMRKGDLGRKVWIRIENTQNSNLNKGTVLGPYLVIDMGAKGDIKSLLEKNFVIDLSYEIANYIGMVNKGGVQVSVWDHKPNTDEYPQQYGSNAP